jgi:hypothetical protein
MVIAVRPAKEAEIMRHSPSTLSYPAMQTLPK